MNIQAILNDRSSRELSPSVTRVNRYNAQCRPLQDLHPTQINTIARSIELTRDDKVGIQAIRKVTSWEYPEIAKKLDKTERQVQKALNRLLTPQKSTCHRNHLLI